MEMAASEVGNWMWPGSLPLTEVIGPVKGKVVAARAAGGVDSAMIVIATNAAETRRRGVRATRPLKIRMTRSPISVKLETTLRQSAVWRTARLMPAQVIGERERGLDEAGRKKLLVNLAREILSGGIRWSGE